MIVDLKGWIAFSEPRTDGMTPEVRWEHHGAGFEKAWGTKSIPITVKSGEGWRSMSNPPARRAPPGYAIIFWQPPTLSGRTDLPGRITDQANTGAREATHWRLIVVPS